MNPFFCGATAERIISRTFYVFLACVLIAMGHILASVPSERGQVAPFALGLAAATIIKRASYLWDSARIFRDEERKRMGVVFVWFVVAALFFFKQKTAYEITR